MRQRAMQSAMKLRTVSVDPAGPASGAMSDAAGERADCAESREKAGAVLLEHAAVEIANSAQECSSDEERFASSTKTIFPLGAERTGEISSVAKRLRRARQTAVDQGCK
jgi:hypothetical protein